jgi:hypothetical protein
LDDAEMERAQLPFLWKRIPKPIFNTSPVDSSFSFIVAAPRLEKQAAICHALHPAGGWIASNKPIIDQTLNRELIKDVYTSGTLKEAKIIGMEVTKQNIQLQVFINGELKLLGGNL